MFYILSNKNILKLVQAKQKHQYNKNTKNNDNDNINDNSSNNNNNNNNNTIIIIIIIIIIIVVVNKDNLTNPQNLRRIDRVRLKEKTKLMDKVLDSVQASNITEDSTLVKCGTLVITQLLWIKEIINKKKEEPFWKRRIESKINALRKDVSLIERWETGILRKESQKTSLDHLYRVKRKGYKRAAEELKQRIKAKAATLT